MVLAAEDVAVRTDNAASRGVTRPPGWDKAIFCAKQGRDEAHSATLEAAACIDVTDVLCEFVGVPKLVPVSGAAGPEVGLAPGVAIPLVHGGGQMNFLLCARITSTNWLVTAGAFHGEHPVDNPFGADSLLEKDVAQDGVCDSTPPPRKRVRAHARCKQLQEQAAEHADKFALLCALARFQAEKLRSERELCAFDLASAIGNVEQNPFKYESGGPLYHSFLVFLWSWVRGGLGTWS